MNWRLLLVGFAVHLVFFYSIFDIYFTSPLVQGMSPQVTKLPPPAKRLVLLVADGLRADRVFELDDDGQSRAPFLRSKMEKEGAWGVSHTRVPTESRPGHVALIAGFYEDVSAVAKGWKENPIEFDSVFNESRQTWAWGSPDILPMFAKGSSGDHVLTEVYPNESEDFAGANLHKLDTWVFDKVDEFLDRCNNDAELKSLVNQDQIVLFLHLLGIDTNGHAHKPDSTEYLSNIRVVDSGIRRLMTKLEDFFDGDNGTAYVFSADHGMTNWGSHGAGHPSETLTPLVAWGAGIRSALPSSGQDRHYTDNYQHEWNLDKVKRSDVNQADIAPLMSALIGIPFPMNSVGLLPLDYLSGPSHYQAESLFTNTRQILAQFEIKMQQKQETTLSVLFTPYKLLTPSVEANRIRQISSLIQRAEYNEAIQVCQQTISLALEGLSYYHNYDRLFLGISITCGYLGWMSYILTTVLKNHTTVVHKSVKIESLGCGFLWSEKGVRVIFLSLGGVIAALLYAQSLPWSHYLYCIIPVVLWKKVFQRRHVFQDLVWYVMDHGLTGRVAVSCVVGLAGLEIMVLSFFHRELLTLGLVAMGIWIFFTPMPEHNKGLAYSWLTCCLITAVFPLMPVMGRQVNYSLVYLAGILSLLLVIFVSRKPEFHPRNTSSNGVGIRKFVIYIQVAALTLSIYIVWSTTNSLNRKEGLPLTNQLASWTILGSSFVLPMLTSTHLYPRLLSVALSMASPYLLLSTAQEGLFLVSMCALMFLWIQVENQLSAITAVRKNKLEELDFSAPVHLGQVQRKLIPDDLRCAFFFIFFLLNGFFGTGNIASINTFDPRSVFCFLTIFSPFTMGALMMWKNLMPLLLVTCTFDAVHLSVNVPTQSFFLLVLLMSDFMALHFFFLVRDYGSWLEIGTSISHYVIVMCLILFLILLLTLSKLFTRISLTRGQASKSHGQ